jgi:hypothetical protein
MAWNWVPYSEGTASVTGVWKQSAHDNIWPYGDGQFRIHHNEKLRGLHRSFIIIRLVKSRRPWWAESVARMVKTRIQRNKMSLDTPSGKCPLERPRRRWEDNTAMDLREIGRKDVRLIKLAQGRAQWRALVLAVLNRRVLGSTARELD